MLKHNTHSDALSDMWKSGFLTLIIYIFWLFVHNYDVNISGLPENKFSVHIEAHIFYVY